jgi:hypothetical protein
MSLFSLLGTAAGAFFGGPAGAAIGGALGGGLDQSNAASDAASTTAAATNQATALQREQWLAQQAQQKPWLEAGQTALNALVPLATNYQPFSYNSMNADPGYQFRLSEGQRALGHQTAARGGAVSGNSLKAMQDYAQNSASGEYQNAFNRYQTQRNAQLAPLQSLAGVGQTAANTLGQAGQNYANTVGGNYINQGVNAGNAGMVGSNALASGLSSALSSYGKVSPNWSNPFSSGSSPATNMTQEQYALVSGY